MNDMERGGDTGRHLLRGALVAGTLGTATLACAQELPPASPEAIPIGSITVCAADDLACESPIAVRRSGNSTPVNNIPALCDVRTGAMVTETNETQVAPDIIWAIMAREDREFCFTEGANLEAFLKAAYETMKGNPQGRSNVAGQVADKYFSQSGPENKFFRELWGTFGISPTIDHLYTKTQVMGMYLNMVYGGEPEDGYGRYGIYEMSMLMFGIPPSQVDTGQAAFLAGALRNPNAYTPKKDPQAEQRALERGTEVRNIVLQDMVDFKINGVSRLTQEQADFYKSQPLGRRAWAPDTARVGSNYAEADRLELRPAVEEIINAASEATGLSSDELRRRNVVIWSTILKEDSEALHTALANNPLAPDGRDYGAIFLDDTGAVTAYRPGRYDTATGHYVDLLKSPVVTGSSAKVIVTMSFLDHGMTAVSEMPNPDYVRWDNYDGTGRTYEVRQTAQCPAVVCTLQVAVQKSISGSFVATVQNFETSGTPVLQESVGRMERLGMNPGALVGPALTLGGQEVEPRLNALGLQQLVATQGLQSDLRFINAIEYDSPDGGRERQEFVPAARTRLEDPAKTAELTNMLLTVPQGGTLTSSFGELATHTQIAGKTGTPGGNSEDERDMNNTAPNAGVIFCGADGRNKTAYGLTRHPNSLTSLGPDADGGGQTAKILADAVRPLIGEYCEIIPAAPQG